MITYIFRMNHVIRDQRLFQTTNIKSIFWKVIKIFDTQAITYSVVDVEARFADALDHLIAGSCIFHVIY